jgi:hypothetical protein
LRHLAAILLTGAALAGSARGQAAGEYEVKAAFLYNFAKFVEWPGAGAPRLAGQLSLCVLGYDPFGDKLKTAVENKSTDSRTIVLLHLNDARQLNSCHILFVSSYEQKRFRSLQEETRLNSVLTVGEAEEFTRDGGIIRFVLEDGRVRLEINLSAAEWAKLRISSKLLSLAKIVRK